MKIGSWIGTALVSMLVVVGCAGGGGSIAEPAGAGAQGSSSVTVVACTQKSSRPDGSDEDCNAKGLPRKLDCDGDTKQQALAAGCVEEGPNDNDVCCPTTVNGTPEGG